MTITMKEKSSIECCALKLKFFGSGIFAGIFRACADEFPLAARKTVPE